MEPPLPVIHSSAQEIKKTNDSTEACKVTIVQIRACMGITISAALLLLRLSSPATTSPFVLLAELKKALGSSYSLKASQSRTAAALRTGS